MLVRRYRDDYMTIVNSEKVLSLNMPLNLIYKLQVRLLISGNPGVADHVCLLGVIEVYAPLAVKPLTL
jgi:hypothetical protein